MTEKEEMEPLVIVTADPETDSMEIDQCQGTEAKAMTETPQDQDPPINLETEMEATPTIDALKGMTVETGHTPETEEVPEDRTEEETDLEKEVNLHLEVAGTAATL